MCTVSYLPQQDGFILTSNRDEKLARPAAIPPFKYRIHGMEIVYPQDPSAGGTWIALGENGTALCLLNGAENHHKSNPPYKQSRGLILLDFWKFSNINAFIQSYDFEGIEPFTLIVAGPGFCQIIRWNEIRIRLENMAELKPTIWSSATLYSPETILDRQKWFAEWLSRNPEQSMASILNFHYFGGKDDPENKLVMKRPDAKQTVSISSIQFNPFNALFLYEDLIYNQTTSIHLPIQPTIHA